MIKSIRLTLWVTLILLISVSCKKTPETKTINVKATAYNSLPGQTHQDHSNITAWGDTLTPGMKIIAVSRNLIDSGLTYKTNVKIEELEGQYIVLDKMHYRWKNRIDIYMGNNRDSALNWGVRNVKITWQIKDNNDSPH
ncbi:MAG: 3D domain-containing protein [Bacteroidales bacterium]|nr:3D domain-containing protein [Bacteroidales bacterium]